MRPPSKGADATPACSRGSTERLGSTRCAAGGKLEAIVDRLEPPTRRRCNDTDAETLGYIGGTDDAVRRSRQACADFTEAFLEEAHSTSAGGAFEGSGSGTPGRCQKVVARALDKLRRATVRVTGQEVYYPSTADAVGGVPRDMPEGRVGSLLRRLPRPAGERHRAAGPGRGAA